VRPAALGLAVLALAFAGCESTQSKSAKLESVAQKSKHEKGLVVAEQSKDVTVVHTTLLQDANGAATVVELRNSSSGSLVGLPISVQVLDKATKPVYANDAPGLDASLVSVAALAPGASLDWVNDQVTVASPGESVVAKLGAGAKPGPATLPQLEVSALKAQGDASGEQSITGDVVNRSQVAQTRLVVYVTGRKGDAVVAAGRAIIERLAPGKSTHFSVFPIGDPNGAQLSAAAPPTVVAP
jgi:hypothetical protein